MFSGAPAHTTTLLACFTRRTPLMPQQHPLSRWLARAAVLAVPFVILAAVAGPLDAQKEKKDKPKKKMEGVWTDPADPTLPADFKFQGEYTGEDKKGNKLGCQVIALDKGHFQAVVYQGGL